MKNKTFSKMLTFLAMVLPHYLVSAQIMTISDTNIAEDPQCPCLRNVTHERSPKNSNGTCIYVRFEDDIGIQTSYCYPLSYGESCAAHDKNLEPACNKTDAQSPEWCFEPFCFIDPDQCKLSEQVYSKSGYLPHLFYSYTTCGGKAEIYDDFLTIQELEGLTLRVGVPSILYPDHYKLDTERNPILFGDFSDGVGDWKGIYIDYITELSIEGKFNINITSVSKGSLIEENNNAWSACNQEVRRGLLDMCVGNFRETTPRAAMTQYTTALVNEFFYMMIPRPDEDKGWLAQMQKVFAPFTIGMWVMMFVLVFSVGLAYSMLRDEEDEQSRAGVEFIDILDRAYYAAMELVKGVDSPRKKSLAQRSVVLGWAFFIVIVVVAYTANLAAFLSSQKSVYKYNSAADCIAQNCKMCCLPNEVVVTSIRRNFPNLRLDSSYVSVPDMLEDLSKGNCDALIISDLQWSINPKWWGKCENTFHGEFMTFFKIGWPLSMKTAKAVSYWIKKTSERQLFENILKKYQGDQVCLAFESTDTARDNGNSPQPMGITQMLGPIVIVYTGIVAGFLYKYSHSLGKNRRMEHA